jgi:hypothetical protein
MTPSVANLLPGDGLATEIVEETKWCQTSYALLNLITPKEVGSNHE